MEKQDLRIIKTQKALCETFLVMLSKKKFDNITVNDLCENAMVRRATFYKHFADKYDFFSFFVRYMQTELYMDIERCTTYDSINSYYKFLFEKFIQFLNNHTDVVKNIVDSSAFPTLSSILSDEIKRNIILYIRSSEKEGYIYKVSPEMIASFFAGGIIQLLRYWITSKVEIPKEKLIDNYEEFIDMFHID